MAAGPGGFSIQQIIELTSESVAQKVVAPLRDDLSEIKQNQATMTERVDELKTTFKEHEEEDDLRFKEVHDRIDKRKKQNGEKNSALSFLVEHWREVLIAVATLSEITAHGQHWINLFK